MLRLCLFLACLQSAVWARVPWSTSRIQGSPEPVKPFVTEPVWTTQDVAEVLEIVGVPGGGAWLVENGGKIWSVPNPGDTGGSKHLILDLKQHEPKLSHAYGLALHPRWRENREVFITYTVGDKLPDGTRLSRFKLSSLEPPVMDPASEEVILTWLCGGHNGAHVQFGPDGMLYVSTGDAEVPAPPDPRHTGQDNSDLLSSILRIDVSRRDLGLAYAVPPDNPWLGKPEVRPEIWAFGFRNPWKMSFDEQGRLWCGDVGWELWEMIHLVGRGTNHGWSAVEASQQIHPHLLSSLVPITPPVVAHPHTEAASITGGYVYRGRRLPELVGAYIYGDYETGKIWALWHDGTRINRHEEIADTPHKIVSFGLLDDGELVYAHWGKPAMFHRLVPNPASARTSSFPRKLSETGLFADLSHESPSEGVHEFEVAEPMWQDGLQGRRFIALPGQSRVEVTVSRRSNGTISGSKVIWPKDAVLAKTLRLAGKDSARVETQVLHFDGEAWNGYSYRWNTQGTDAELVEAGGGRASLQGKEHSFHARAECARCHTPWAGFVLGFQPQQLVQVAGRPANEGAVAAGLVPGTFFEASKARLVSSRDTREALDERARSWLHANCAHCHRQHGGGSVALKVNLELPLAETELLGAKPLRGDLGLTDSRLIAPGAPWRSALLARIARTGAGRMPIIGSHQVDSHGFQLLWEWIEDLGRRNSPRSEPPASDSKAVQEPLTASRTLQAIHAHEFQSEVVAKTDFEAGLKSSDPNIAPLFERFLPPDQRRKVIGPQPDVAQLLGLSGDARRGEALMSPDGALSTCLACHFVNGTGRDFGPDLSKVGSRLSKEQLLESLLHPSRTIAEGYSAQMAELADGTSQLGFVVKRTADHTVFKLPTGQSIPLRHAEIRSLKPLPASLMPEGLLQSLTPAEVADVLAYLRSLK